jgi:hypothetical protein
MNRQSAFLTFRWWPPVFAAAVLALAWTPAATAEDASEGPAQSWWLNPVKVEKLALTSDQVARIAEVETSFEKPIATARQERVKAYRHVVRLLDAGDYSPEELAEKTAAFQEAFAAEVQVKVDHWAALRSVLDADQWTALPTVAPQDLLVGGFGISARGKVFMGGPGVGVAAPSGGGPKK